ncbi:multidrug resistance protein 4 [Mycena rebaudengoi]|nr:multidrug resistance protein 4 [Mycena rebaudengoi]
MPDNASLSEKTTQLASELDEKWAADPQNPRNWTTGRKWTAAGVVASYNFIAPFGSSIVSPALSDIAHHYHMTSPTLIAMTLSVYVLAFAVGPLIFGPLSEHFGRVWVLHLGNLAVVAFALGCAFAPTANALIVFRFLCGIAVSPPLACGGGCISDLFEERDRAAAMSLFIFGPLLGPVIGPIAGGFISECLGFRWIFIVLALIAGGLALLGIPLLRETYAPVLRARQLKKEFVEPDAERLREVAAVTAQEGVSEKIWINLSRAVILLTTSFICFILSLYNSLMYGVYFLMFVTFPPLFVDTYGFSVGISGLTYLGLGIGFFLASAIGAVINKQFYVKLAERNGGIGKPEFRIPAMIFGSLFVPVGLLWYGWSAAAKLHWIMPIMGTGIFAFGFTSTFIPLQLYLVDTFTYSASALAATSVLRSIFGFVFPLFAKKMFEAMGTGGGNSFLAGMCILIGIPFPIWIYFHGEKIRARSSLLNR